MGNFQYKNSSGNWVDVPDYAHPDDEGGEIVLMRPEPTARDATGLPCGAVGLPAIVIRSKIMRGDGWAWWQSFFADAETLSTTLNGLTAFDPRTGQWKKYYGTLLRPTGKCKPGASLVRTVYEDVEIIVDGVTETS